LYKAEEVFERQVFFLQRFSGSIKLHNNYTGGNILPGKNCINCSICPHLSANFAHNNELYIWQRNNNSR
jgi:hypothetical protein